MRRGVSSVVRQVFPPSVETRTEFAPRAPLEPTIDVSADAARSAPNVSIGTARDGPNAFPPSAEVRTNGEVGCCRAEQSTANTPAGARARRGRDVLGVAGRAGISHRGPGGAGVGRTAQHRRTGLTGTRNAPDIGEGAQDDQ